MSESVLADLKLAVTEACGNAVRHAYAETRRVWSRSASPSSPARSRSWSRTTATPHAVAERTRRALPSDGMPAESGMGLAIIEAVVDDARRRAARRRQRRHASSG